MRTEKLTQTEIAELRRAYKKTPLFTEKQSICGFAFSLLVSAPFCIFFSLAAHFIHHYSWTNSFIIGAYSIPIGPGLFLLLLIVMLFGDRHSSFHKIIKEIDLGECTAREYRVCRAWPLVDQGNFDTPDLLIDIGKSRFVAISIYTSDPQPKARHKVILKYLPESGISVSAEFTGDIIPLGNPIVTESVWRNDDLPYMEPIAKKKLPSEALAIV